MKVLRHLPNLISVIRLLLIVPITMSILEGNYLQGILLFAIAGISDGLDGYLARKFDWISAFGTIIDPVADKLLLLAISIALTVLGHFPVMLLLLLMTKDLVILGGVLVYTVMAGFPEIRPLFIGKVTTTVQLLLLGYILVTLIMANMPVLSTMTPLLIWIVVSATLLDGCLYLWVWTVKLAHDSRWNPLAEVEA